MKRKPDKYDRAAQRLYDRMLPRFEQADESEELIARLLRRVAKAEYKRGQQNMGMAGKSFDPKLCARCQEKKAVTSKGFCIACAAIEDMS